MAHLLDWVLFLVAEQLYNHRCLSVFCLFVCNTFFCLNDQDHIAWFTSGVARRQLEGSSGAAQRSKMTFDGRQPLLEDDLWWETTYDGRRPLMEDDLCWKTTFDGRRPSVEDDLQWKTTFTGRRPSMEDTLQWKTTFAGRQPSMEENICMQIVEFGKGIWSQDSKPFRCTLRFAAFFWLLLFLSCVVLLTFLSCVVFIAVVCCISIRYLFNS